MTGDRRAHDELVATCLPAIRSMARGYRGASTIAPEEFIQAGVLGLLRALARFDPSRGTRFWAYASWWVRQAMQQLVAEIAYPVVLSDRAFRELARLRRAQEARGRDASVAQLAASAPRRRAHTACGSGAAPPFVATRERDVHDRRGTVSTCAVAIRSAPVKIRSTPTIRPIAQAADSGSSSAISTPRISARAPLRPSSHERSIIA